MKFLQDLFLAVFSTIYPLVHNSLVSYILIFVLFAYLAYINWKKIKSLSKASTTNALLLRIILITLEVFLVLFLAWYILIHFPTYAGLA